MLGLNAHIDYALHKADGRMWSKIEDRVYMREALYYEAADCIGDVSDEEEGSEEENAERDGL